MVVGIVLVLVGLAMLAAGWRAWSGGWRSWAAVDGPPWWNAPITTLPATGVFALGLGISALGGGPVVGGIGLVLFLVSIPVATAAPHWWGPRWYRAGDWPQPADGFGRRLGRWSAAWTREGDDDVPGELILRPDQIVFLPSATGSPGLGIAWSHVSGARAEDRRTLCVDAGGPLRFAMDRPGRAAKRIESVAGARADGAATTAPAAAASRRDRIEPL